MRDIHARKFSAWSPGLDNLEAWKEWAEGKREIPASNESPALDFPESQWYGVKPGEIKTFKRRLSQLSKMTIQVIHDLQPLEEHTKTVFISFRGEIGRQFRINQTLIEEETVMPAAFSLSVFNTPPAVASIALNLRGGYSALYPADGRFTPGLLAAAAPLFSGQATEVLLVYADELAPPEYSGLISSTARPMAFGVVLSRRALPGSAILNTGSDTQWDDPRGFLRFLIDNAPWGKTA
jgi:hypothetical protein